MRLPWTETQPANDTGIKACIQPTYLPLQRLTETERLSKMYWNIVIETKVVKQPAHTYAHIYACSGLVVLCKIVVFSKPCCNKNATGQILSSRTSVPSPPPPQLFVQMSLINTSSQSKLVGQSSVLMLHEEKDWRTEESWWGVIVHLKGVMERQSWVVTGHL